MILKNKKNKILIIVIFLFIVVVGSLSFVFLDKGIEVEVENVDKGEVIKTLEETGSIETKNNNIYYSKLSGMVKEFNLKVGDTLKKGDIILIIDTNELELKLKSIESKIDAIRFEYKEALKKVDSEKINQMMSRINVARINYYDAKDNYEKNAELYEKGVISKKTLDVFESNFKISKENLDSANNDLKLLEKGISNNIKEKFLKEIESLEYEADIIRNSIEDSVLIATKSFVIVDKYVNKGEVIPKGYSVLKYNDFNNVVKVDVLATEARDIKNGTKVYITDTNNEFKYEGKVIETSPSAFTKISDLGIEQKRVKFEVYFPEINNFVLGYDLDVQFVINERKDVLRVSDRAVFEKNSKHYVFVLEGDVVKLREIQVGLKGDDYIEIIKGLKLGDKVVLSPDNALEDGEKIILLSTN